MKRSCIYALIALTVVLVACGTQENQKRIETNQTKNSHTQTNQQTNQNQNNSNQHVATANIEQAPPKDESQATREIDWTNETEGTEAEWREKRELFISQYLKNPESIVWGIKRTIPASVKGDLEKGYGIYWSPLEEVSKELEYGFFKARCQETKAVTDNLQALKRQGTGREYYLLAYIASWHHCLGKEYNIAKEIAEQSHLFQNIENFAIKIPQTHLASLKENLDKATSIDTSTQTTNENAENSSTSQDGQNDTSSTTEDQITEESPVENQGTEESSLDNTESTDSLESPDSPEETMENTNTAMDTGENEIGDSGLEDDLGDDLGDNYEDFTDEDL